MQLMDVNIEELSVDKFSMGDSCEEGNNQNTQNCILHFLIFCGSCLVTGL